MTTYIANDPRQAAILESWNVGSADEWDADVQTLDDVRLALLAQGETAGWFAGMSGDQIDALIDRDAPVVYTWLVADRG